MTDDPRERIETEHIRCDDITPTQWIIAAVGQHAPAFADWPEVVAFAHAVLAADAEWKRSLKPCDCPCSGVACDEYADVHNYLACGHCEHDEECHAKLEELTDGK